MPSTEGDGVTQTPDEFVRLQSATTGMPQALCRGNMEKIRFVLHEMETVLGGLTRGLDLRRLDRGWVEQGGRTVSYLARPTRWARLAQQLARCALAVDLRRSVEGAAGAQAGPRGALDAPADRPGALIAAGLSARGARFYPTDYAGAAEILLRCERSMFFGDVSTVEAWKGEKRESRSTGPAGAR